MNKKKYVAILTAILLMTSLSGCDNQQNAYYESVAESSEARTVCGGYFTVLYDWYIDNDMARYYIIYANDTKVKYLLVAGKFRSGITPLYNPDGTLQIYEG